nr:Mu transposase C-terminal domain-containing protein [Macrococcus caseolyticus]
MEKEMITDGIVPTLINLWNWGIQNRKGRLRTVDRDILSLNELPRGRATISRAGIKFKNFLYGSKRAIEEQWYAKLKNKSIDIVYDLRHLDKIYIPSDNGMDYEICILLEPSQQYKLDFLEDVVFQQQLRNELEEEERAKQIQLTINADTMMDQIIKAAEKRRNRHSISQQVKKKSLMLFEIIKRLKKSLIVKKKSSI